MSSIVDHAMKIPGSTERQELDILERFARQYIKTNACEVGSEYGRSAYVIGSVCKEKNANFYVLDIENKLVEDLEDIPMKFIEGDSRETHTRLPMLDFVFIDGDHTMPTVFYDLVNFWDKMNPGGLFCGHDYRELDKSTSEVKLIIDNVWKFRGAAHIKGTSIWFQEK